MYIQLWLSHFAVAYPSVTLATLLSSIGSSTGSYSQGRKQTGDEYCTEHFSSTDENKS